jgi:hypothetical protein
MAIVRLKGLGQLKKILIGTPSRDLPVCSIVPQPTTLPRARMKLENHLKSSPQNNVFKNSLSTSKKTLYISITKKNS